MFAQSLIGDALTEDALIEDGQGDGFYHRHMKTIRMLFMIFNESPSSRFYLTYKL